MAQLVLVARRSTVSRAAGLLGGAAVALSLVGRRGDLGLGITFAAPGFAVCALTGVLVGECLGNPSATRTRTALLEVRTASDYLPRAMTYWVLGLTAMLAVVLTTTSLVADPDDMGRAGRAFTVACGPRATVGVGPWPGTYYSLPIAVTVLVGGILAAAVLLTVLRRPRPAVDDTARAIDDGLRRSSARAVTAACGLVVSAPLAGATLLGGTALLKLACGPAPHLGLLSLAVAALAFAASGVFVAAIRPGR